MGSIAPLDEPSASLSDGPGGPTQQAHTPETQTQQTQTPETREDVTGLPVLGAEEAAVLALMSQSGHCLTFGTIRSRSGIETQELRSVLENLRADGLVVRLNTVVESYACRFPGLDVDTR